MVDSISYRIHTPRTAKGIYEVHGDLVRALLVNSTANQQLIKNSIDFRAYSVPVMANELALLPMDFILKQFHWEDGERKTDYIKGRFHVPSSHYDVGYRVDIDREFIDISFSIPKYLYGHSVAQFCRNPHFDSVYEHETELRIIAKDVYKMLMQVTRDFFENTFVGITMNYHYVEIIRIDFAFNQYFKSKQEALYLGELMAQKRTKELRGKLGRKDFVEEGTETVQQYSSGFASIQRNVYYKVYHKGTEFAKNDSKRLVKHNDRVTQERNAYKKDQGSYDDETGEYILSKEERKFLYSGRRTYDVEGLQREADLIMRHEIRYYKKTFSYYWKRELFRRKSRTWIKKKRRYKDIHNKWNRYDRLRKDEDRLTKEEYKEMRDIRKILDKRHNFLLKVHQKVKHHGENMTPIHENYFDEALFSRELVEFLLNKFIKIIESVQVKEFPKWDSFRKSIDEFNEQIDLWNGYVLKDEQDKKISVTAMRKAYKLMVEYGSLDKAFDNKELTRPTYYRYRKDLERLDYSSVLLNEPVETETNFSTYFERMRGFGYGLREGTYKTLFANTPSRYRKIF